MIIFKKQTNFQYQKNQNQNNQKIKEIKVKIQYITIQTHHYYQQ